MGRIMLEVSDLYLIVISVSIKEVIQLLLMFCQSPIGTHFWKIFPTLSE